MVSPKGMKKAIERHRSSEPAAGSARFSSLKWVDLDQVCPAAVGLLQPRARLEGTCLLISGENKIFLK